jgi:hypothetical protein
MSGGETKEYRMEKAENRVSEAPAEDKSGKVLVFTPYITVRGKRIYPKNARVFRFWGTPRNVN